MLLNTAPKYTIHLFSLRSLAEIQLISSVFILIHKNPPIRTQTSRFVPTKK